MKRRMWIISYIGAVLLLFAFWVVKAEAREGWSLEDENWYYMELDGHMITGWKKLNGVWYYMNSSGQMVTGRQDIKGKQRLPFSGIGLFGLYRVAHVQFYTIWKRQ